MHRLLLGGMLSGLLLAACSSGSSTPPTPKADLADLEARASLASCHSSAQPLTAAAAVCTLGESQVTLATFVTNDQRDLWASAQKGVTSGPVVVGDGWAATALEPETGTAIAAALGGTVRP